MPRLTNLHSIIQNGVTLAAAARGFGVCKSTASCILARLNDTSDVRNHPPPLLMSNNGKTDLIIANGNLRYRDEILLAHALPYASAISNGLQLVDDNTRAHPGEGVTRQMNVAIKTAMAIKKFRVLTNHASAFMKDRINTKATHRHMLVDLRGMAVEELQNLPQCLIIDLFGP